MGPYLYISYWYIKGNNGLPSDQVPVGDGEDEVTLKVPAPGVGLGHRNSGRVIRQTQRRNH